MDTLLEEIEAYLKATGETPAGFGKAALKDPSFVLRLRRGRNYTMATYRKVMKFIEES